MATTHPFSSSLQGTRIAHFEKHQIKPLISGAVGLGYQKGIHSLPQAPHINAYGPIGRGIHNYTGEHYKSTRGPS
jgi:hypothetical protein